MFAVRGDTDPEWSRQAGPRDAAAAQVGAARLEELVVREVCMWTRRTDEASVQVAQKLKLRRMIALSTEWLAPRSKAGRARRSGPLLALQLVLLPVSLVYETYVGKKRPVDTQWTRFLPPRSAA